MKSPFPKDTYRKNAVVYKILANPKRLEILNIIKHREARVEDLIKIVGINKTNMSQHLSVLRKAKLVQVRRAGLFAFYTISDSRIVEPCRILHEMRARKTVRVKKQ